MSPPIRLFVSRLIALFTACFLVQACCSDDQFGSSTLVQQIISGNLSPDIAGITPSNPSLTVQDLQLQARIPGQNGVPQDITNEAIWTSSDSSVAAVTPQGLVTPRRAGAAIITATFQGITFATRVSVNKALARDWTNRIQHRAVFGNGLFVSVGTGGKIVTSPDGANWTVRDS